MRHTHHAKKHQRVSQALTRVPKQHGREGEARPCHAKRTLESAATLTGVKIPFFAAVTPKMQQQRSSPTALDDAFATAGLITDPTAAGSPASMAMPPPPRTLLNVLNLLAVAAVGGVARLLPGWWWCCLRQGAENRPCGCWLQANGRGSRVQSVEQFISFRRPCSLHLHRQTRGEDLETVGI